MNIDCPEVTNIVVAKTCGCMKGKRKVAYQFLEEYHGLSMDKKDTLTAQHAPAKSFYTMRRILLTEKRLLKKLRN